MKDVNNQDKINFANPEVGDISSLDLLDREDLLAMMKKMISGGIALTFSGKRTAAEIDSKVIPRQTMVLKNYCVGSPEEQARNMLVEGENLQALVTLFKYRGQVDLIITDPPYNTGEDFRYNDKWDTDPNDPELGILVAKEDGSRHTKWMKSMLPRLNKMKEMLKYSGIIAICIDYRELFRLGMLMDEVFNEENRIGIINWQKKYAPTNDSKHLSSATEYILIYARREEESKTALLERTKKMNSRYSNPDDDPIGLWANGDPTAATPTRKDRYAIQSPFTGALHYPGSRAWSNPKKSMKRMLEKWGSSYIEKTLNDSRAKALVIKDAPIPDIPTNQNLDNNSIIELKDFSNNESFLPIRQKAEEIRLNETWSKLYFLADGVGRPRTKRYLNEVKQGKVPMTFWANEDYDAPFELDSQSWLHTESGHSQTGINELNTIMGKGHKFQTVKPLKLFKKIIQLWCPPDGLVLDAYAGSGTTGHAVLELNHEIEESNRRFILIEQGSPENGDKYAKTLTQERLRRAILGLRPTKQGGLEQTADPLGGGFRYLRLTKTVNAKAVMSMKKEDLIDIVIVSHWDEKKRNSNLIRIENKGYKYLVGKNESNNGYFIIWNGGDAVESFDDEAYQTVVKEAKQENLTAPYYVYARRNFYQVKTVVFHKIPDKILAHLGLNESSDSYHQGDY